MPPNQVVRPAVGSISALRRYTQQDAIRD